MKNKINITSNHFPSFVTLSSISDFYLLVAGDWEAITKYWEEIFAAYDNQHLSFEKLTMLDENTVGSEWTISAKQVATSFGIPATNKVTPRPALDLLFFNCAKSRENHLIEILTSTFLCAGGDINRPGAISI